MLELTEFYRYFHLGLIPANYKRQKAEKEVRYIFISLVKQERLIFSLVLCTRKNNKNLVSLPYLTSNH